MDGPETKIALSAVARNYWPIALILPWDHIQWRVVRPPREHHSGSFIPKHTQSSVASLS